MNGVGRQVELHVEGADLRLVFIGEFSQYSFTGAAGLHLIINQVEFKLQADGAFVDKVGGLKNPIENFEIVEQSLAVSRALLRSVCV